MGPGGATGAGRKVLALLGVAGVLAGPQAAPAAASCHPGMLVGTYVYTLGGTDTSGAAVAEIGAGTTTAPRPDGTGSFSGVYVANERGEPAVSGSFSGHFQFSENCVVEVFITSGSRSSRLTGFVSEGGSFIQFASIFDPARQVTGVARRIDTAPAPEPGPAPAEFTLSVSKGGNGSGRVTSDVGGISCAGGDSDVCAATLPAGTQVTLTAAPAGGGQHDVFAGWGGDCAFAGTGLTCVLVMTEARALTATFNTR